MAHHRIFISKGTLDLGRNREQRRLEAQLDNGQETELVRDKETNLSNSNSSPAHTLGDNSKLNTFYSPQEPLLFCSYITDCNRACFQNTDKYNLCMIRKFKDKYKDFDYGRQLGI